MQILKQRHSIKLDDKKRQEKYLDEQIEIQKEEKGKIDAEVEELGARVLEQGQVQKDLDAQI